MELIFPFTIPILSVIFAFFLFVYFVLRMSRSVHGETRKSRVLAPKAAGAWPLIGHLPLLAGPQPNHQTLGRLADKYGPIFTIRLGVHPALVVNSWEIAKECFTINDKVISTRPKAIAFETMGYNYAMFGSSPYGSYWRELRKIVILELLSNHQLAMIVKPVLESEVKSSIKETYDLWIENISDSNKVSMEMDKWFECFTLNLIVRIVIGKRQGRIKTLSERDELHEALKQFFKFMAVFTISDALPFLRWLDLGGYEKAMKKLAKELDHVAQGWLEDHKEKEALGKATDEKDFMDVMLSSLHKMDYGSSGFDADTINKATCLIRALILAASDTTTVTLIWCLSLLLNHNHALKKVLDELDTHVGKHRQVKESDLKNLVYLQAVVKETLRLYPVAQLVPSREFMEDCTMAGYYVPVGTRIFFNLWKIQKDPRVWTDHLEFRPERFFTTHKDVDVRGQDFGLLPFGSGQRICPGISFALQVVHFTLANVIHAFEFSTPSNEPVDMTESFGFTNHKASPLEVFLAPRLSADIYG